LKVTAHFTGLHHQKQWENSMSFLTPKAPQLPPPPPVPEVASKTEMARSAALAEEATRKARKRRGRGSTIVAGALGEQQPTTGKPTLLG
jgi:hypothetical protein